MLLKLFRTSAGPGFEWSMPRQLRHSQGAHVGLISSVHFQKVHTAIKINIAPACLRVHLSLMAAFKPLYPPPPCHGLIRPDSAQVPQRPPLTCPSLSGPPGPGWGLGWELEQGPPRPQACRWSRCRSQFERCAAPFPGSSARWWHGWRPWGDATAAGRLYTVCTWRWDRRWSRWPPRSAWSKMATPAHLWTLKKDDCIRRVARLRFDALMESYDGGARRAVLTIGLIVLQKSKSP